MAHDHEASRSPEWPRVEKAHLAIEPECICCGPTWKPGTAVQVHHIFPVAYIRALGRPELELSPVNLITLCETEQGKPGENHHLLIGHLDDFEAANPDTRADAALFRGQNAAQIRASLDWQSKVRCRLPTLAEMSFAQKHALRALMDRRMPFTPG
jgi:5-methylcytosine-specific restriction enzyme A